MREIKFRGYYTGDPDRNEGWVYGSIVKRQHPKFGRPCYFIEKEDGEVFIVKTESVGQFTGECLPDEEPIDIYEGDIINDSIVVFEKGSFIAKGKYPHLSQLLCNYLHICLRGDEGVVINGNKYQNPELLK